MLLEIRNARQVPGESRRRWFFSHEMDLLVWFDDEDRPTAFQLCYGKYRNERAIRWKTGQGFAHYRVDDGGTEDGRVGSGTPLMMAGGVFEAPRVLQRFRELSARMPTAIAEFVSARLREHPEYRRYPAPSTNLPGPDIVYVAIGLAVVGVALLFWSRKRKTRAEGVKK
jgi:LPXTG-motif cell wall-anchored protein